MAAIPDLTVVAVIGLFWGAITVAWAPLLAAESLQRLVAGWPTDRGLVNYGLGMAAFVMLHVIALSAGIALAGGVNMRAFLDLALAVTVGVVGLAWAGLSLVAPRIGWWRPTNGGYDGRVLLAVGGLWYVVCSLVAAAVLSLVSFLLFFPG